MSIDRRTLIGLAAGVISVAFGKNASRTNQQMTEQERNKQVVRDYFERCFNTGDLAFGRSIMIPDYNYHLPLPPGTSKGYEGWKRGVGAFRVAFPDCHWEIHQILAEADLVSVRTVWTGTHSGEFMGVPASGRRVKVANSDYYRLHDGKFVEHWDVPDYLAILRQIGGTLENTSPRFAASIDP